MRRNSRRSRRPQYRRRARHSGASAFCWSTIRCDNRNLVVAYLKKLPYLIDQAENGEVAFTRFVIGKYDLVLMDMQMPLLDGYGAVRKIREWERTNGRRPTPIAALTASALQEDVQRTIEAGCSSHMSKPIKKSRLLQAIVDLTRSREAAIENDAPAIDSAPAFSERTDYLARTRRDIYAMAAALESGDYHTLKALARKIQARGRWGRRSNRSAASATRSRMPHNVATLPKRAVSCARSPTVSIESKRAPRRMHQGFISLTRLAMRYCGRLALCSLPSAP